jgi:metallophosphoesterase (TIGR00282 family)
MKILMIGDIYGDAGIDILTSRLPELKQQYKPHLIIANAENAANGRGITKKIYKHLMEQGIHVLTMGNHVFANRELATFIDGANIVRPINFLDAPGKGTLVYHFNDKKVLIINALGRAFMNLSLENPFTEIKKAIEETHADMVIVDFHAEATSEKVALAHYLDGKADIIYGTHTHVQTNDSRILPKGTFYLTDIGMTGPLNGIIGVQKDIVIERFINGFSSANVVADGSTQLNAWFVDTELKLHQLIHLESN